MYFGIGIVTYKTVEKKEEVQKPKPAKKVVPVQKKKKRAPEGGC
jgi:hypothetical protein